MWRLPLPMLTASALSQSTLAEVCIRVTGVFFFSSRRRHTRLQGDWSSDVCSSDLLRAQDWLCVVGAGTRTRVRLQIVRLPNGAVDFRFHSDDRDDQWGSTNPNQRDRKSTRLNSSHLVISYAVFCLKKKNNRSGVYYSRGDRLKLLVSVVPRGSSTLHQAKKRLLSQYWYRQA